MPNLSVPYIRDSKNGVQKLSCSWGFIPKVFFIKANHVWPLNPTKHNKRSPRKRMRYDYDDCPFLGERERKDLASRYPTLQFHHFSIIVTPKVTSLENRLSFVSFTREPRVDNYWDNFFFETALYIFQHL